MSGLLVEKQRTATISGHERSDELTAICILNNLGKKDFEVNNGNITWTDFHILADTGGTRDDGDSD